MKILAIDTTAKTATAALTEDEKLIGLVVLNTPNTHSVTLLPAIEGLLSGASVTVDDIDLYVCSAGPGSFTGVRIGTSTIKGLAYAQGKTCIGVSRRMRQCFGKIKDAYCRSFFEYQRN